MDPVPLQEISRYHWVKNDDADMTPPQSINDGRNISGALFLRPEETEIISARLQDDDIGVVGYIAIDAAEHAGGSITDDAGAGDYSIDAALLEDGMQSCREGILCINAPTHCIAGANQNNVERAGMTGPDANEHHRNRKSEHYGHYGSPERDRGLVAGHKSKQSPVRCCARAASGHTAAAPPRSVMNSRRFMPVPKLRKQHCIGSNEYFDRG
jgi:hypothetical protein